MKKTLVGTILALCLVLTSCGGDKDTKESIETKNTEQSQSIDQASSAEVGEEKSSIMTEAQNDGPMALDLNLVDFDGNKWNLSDQRGKKVYIKFWASWCPICMDSMDELNQMFAHKDEKDYELVTVVTPGQMGEKNQDDFIEWYKGLGYDNIKILMDPSGKVLSDYGIRSAPTNIMVGSDGVLMGVVPGQIDEATIDKVFDQIQ